MDEATLRAIFDESRTSRGKRTFKKYEPIWMTMNKSSPTSTGASRTWRGRCSSSCSNADRRGLQQGAEAQPAAPARPRKADGDQLSSTAEVSHPSDAALQRNCGSRSSRSAKTRSCRAWTRRCGRRSRRLEASPSNITSPSDAAKRWTPGTWPTSWTSCCKRDSSRCGARACARYYRIVDDLKSMRTEGVHFEVCPRSL